MIDHNFSFVCDSASVSPDGKAYFLGVFSDIVGKSKPVRHSSLTLVFNFSSHDIKTHKLEIFLKSPSGKDMMKPFEKNVKAPSARNPIGHILNVANINFEEEGEYTAIFHVDGKLIRKINFNFKVNKQ